MNSSDINKSKEYSLEQIKYVKNAINYIKGKLSNPKFFIWSNNFDGLNEFFPSEDYTLIKNDQILEKGRRPLLDLFLMSQAKHFITIPSSFNWWGAYLSKSKNKIIIRPDKKNFTNFKTNNSDFWPNEWIKI